MIGHIKYKICIQNKPLQLQAGVGFLLLFIVVKLETLTLATLTLKTHLHALVYVCISTRSNRGKKQVEVDTDTDEEPFSPLFTNCGKGPSHSFPSSIIAIGFWFLLAGESIAFVKFLLIVREKTHRVVQEKIHRVTTPTLGLNLEYQKIWRLIN